jgi:hypothetical protein
MNKQDIFLIVIYVVLGINLITLVHLYFKMFSKKYTKSQASTQIKNRDSSPCTDTEYALISEYEDALNLKSHKSFINQEILATFTYIKDKSHPLFKNRELPKILENILDFDKDTIYKIPDDKVNEFVNLVRLIESDKLITKKILDFYSPVYLYIIVYNFYNQIKSSKITLFHLVTQDTNENIIRNILSNMICSSIDQRYDNRVLEELNKKEASNRSSVYDRNNCIIKMEVYINFLRIFFNKKQGSFTKPEDLITYKKYAIDEGWYEEAVRKLSQNKILSLINQDVFVYWKDANLSITFLDFLIYVYENLFEDCKKMKSFSSTKHCSKENEEIYKNSYL